MVCVYGICTFYGWRARELLKPLETLHSVSDNFDLITMIAAASISELDAITNQIGTIEGVARTRSSIILFDGNFPIKQGRRHCCRRPDSLHLQWIRSSELPQPLC